MATQDIECSICLQSLNNCLTITLPCSHAFHVRCIYQWNQHKTTCPMCRCPFTIKPKLIQIDCEIDTSFIQLKVGTTDTIETILIFLHEILDVPTYAINPYQISNGNYNCRTINRYETVDTYIKKLVPLWTTLMCGNDTVDELTLKCSVNEMYKQRIPSNNILYTSDEDAEDSVDLITEMYIGC